ALFAICCGFCAFKLLTSKTPASGASLAEPAGLAEESSRFTPFRTRILWLALPACASVLLLATTNKLCQDVAVIPFLWILPLALYLLSFIICFDSPRWYVRPIFAIALVAALTAITWALFEGIDASVRKQVMIYSSGLFVCCM